MAVITDKGILRTFLEEVRGHVPALEREVMRLREPGIPEGAMDEVHRLAHTIRSASEMIGLANLAEAARGVETLASDQAWTARLDPDRMEHLELGVVTLRTVLDLVQDDGSLAATGAAEPQTPPADEVDEEIFGAFSTEAEQLLDQIRGHLQILGGQPGDSAPSMGPLSHAVHTLKGAAGMAGLSAVSGLAHRMEDVLALVESKVLPAEPEIIDLLLSTHDLIGDVVASRGLAATLQGAFESVNERYDLLASLASESAATAPPAPEDDSLAEVEETDESLLDTFMSEAEAYMLLAGDAFRALATAPPDPLPYLTEMRRASHTIKGAAGMVGLMAVSRLAKSMQFLLDAIAARNIRYTPAIYELLGDTFDLLAELIESRGQNAPYLERLQLVLARLERALSDRAASDSDTVDSRAKADAPSLAPSLPASSDAGLQTVRVAMDRLSGVSRVVGEIFFNASAFEQQIAAFKREMDELSLNLSRMRRISSALAEEQTAEGVGHTAQPAPASGSASEFDVLEFDRYSRLHLLSKDLSEATSDLSALSGQLNSMRSQMDSWVSRQRGLSGEAQDKLMRMRLVPLSTVANRLQRTVRMSAAKTGKQAALFLEGMDTEFDKSVVEQLSGPLEHLLRNAVDHGLESPAERLALGKQAVGSIRLEASTQGANLVIRLSDDGAGIDEDRVRQQAVRLGWLTPETARDTASEELAKLILEPGFSTAKTVSEISGRGVGLDVVSAAVSALRGRLSIQSARGHGATFTLRLPLSLAMARTMIVETAGVRLAVPMVTFKQALRIHRSELEMRGDRPGIQLAGGWVPVLRLADWLGLPETGDSLERCTLLFVDNGEREIALAVDRVIEAREVVVKPLTGILKRQANFSGATILGDGAVVLILNLSTLDANAAQNASAQRPLQQRQRREVLVVDDSLSVRRSVANLMKSAGWTVTTARDGMEGLEQLQQMTHQPDLVIMDIEMPRMDGYELATRLRAKPEFDSVPLIILTSRAGEKHRRKASGLGVDGYLVKPCPDDVFLEEVARCLALGRQPGIAS
jgi:chemosensory pili system protein ChpA (sensor histidine kinase/response regulator)